jgi:hypothetical protein
MGEPSYLAAIFNNHYMATAETALLGGTARFVDEAFGVNQASQQSSIKS